MEKHRYTKEENDFLIANVKGISVKELTNKFNSHFGLNLTYSSIKSHKESLKLKNGRDTRIKKGNVPFTKGKTWAEYMSEEGQENSKKTWFSSTDRNKQNANYNFKPVFSERVDSDGYILIKLKEPNKWVLKHRWIYEQHYNCKIPKGFVVIFLDGNKQNLDINNLALISKNQHKIMNKNQLRYDTAEATLSAIKVAQLIEAIGKRKGEIKNGR